ncbi:MAG: hybrid sensor histidine kinase/response regulator [Pseudomonadota bacterium]
MTTDEAFIKKLLATFRIEAEEHIAAISGGLLELEKQPLPERQKEIVEVIFREAHSLKGAARSVNLVDIELVCQAMEGLFAALKREEMVLSPPLFDLLNDAADIVGRLLSLADTALTAADRAGVQAIKEKLADAAKGKLPSSVALLQGTGPLAPPPFSPATGDEGQDSGLSGAAHENVGPTQPEPPPTLGAEKGDAGSETIRISAAKLESLLLKAEEFVSAKLAARRQATLTRELKTLFDAWKKQWAKLSSEVRSSSETTAEKPLAFSMSRFSASATIDEFIEWNQHFSRNMETRLLGLRTNADEDSRFIGAMVDNLLDDMKHVMMLPFSSVLATFPRLIRDISREQGKEIEFSLEGGDIEIDKRILQEIRDPLNHLVRNSIDHGIETQEVRRQKAKPAQGSLKIIVAQRDSGKVEILIVDDGAGISIDRIKGSALKQGLITEEQAAAMNREEALAQIFESGVTTSALITTVSGRGLGMAIVREKIGKLGGTVSIQTTPDQGTTISILLPFSLATFRGILVQTGGQLFAVPSMHVEGVRNIPWHEVQTVENRETIPLDGKAVSLVRLDQVLELPPKTSADEEAFLCVMVLSAGDKELAFAIDEMLYEDEILLKSLGNQLTRVRNIAGATVLGTGRVVPILNVADLIKSALRISAGSIRAMAAEESKREKRARSILVVEDSITARTLFVNILETAGYLVTSAVDGIDGFIKLGEGDFDLVVSDIEMPRMNGFELTAKIRTDKRWGAIPVVIVTSRESPEDKKRGIEVGANAYLVKSSFDQSNLIEVIQRLI